ncbi:MAG: hypothetical protein AABY10_00490 [Nanoarchaeota archaeon]
MTSANNEDVIFKRKEGTNQYNNIKITIKTRIFRYKDSKYENAPSREIKKWFESRRI